MNSRVTSLLVALALLAGTTTTSAFDIHSLLNADAAVDSNAKPCILSQTELAALLAPSPATTQTTTQTQTSTSKYILISSLLPEAFATAAAQRLTPTGYQVCQVAITPGEINHLPGEVVLLRASSAAGQQQQMPIVYYGKRNADTLALFVERLDARYSSTGPGFSTITNKIEKKAFERLQGAKVIGFFPDPTAADQATFVEFQQAARQLAPNPPFFVVHDTHFAHKLKLNEPGQIALLHRAEKSIVYFQRETPVQAATTEAAAPATPATPATPVTAAEIAAWVAKHRGYILHELDDTNLYDPEVLDPTKYLFAAVADQTSPLGLYFHKVLTKSIQNISRENELRANQSAAAVAIDQTTHLPSSTAVQPAPLQPIPLDDIEIIWIDLQKYPLAAQKIAENLNLNTAAGSGNANSNSNNKAKDVHFGLVQVPSGVLTNAQANQWFDVSQLQAASQSLEKREEANIALLRDWILAVTDRLPKPVESPAAAGAAGAAQQIEVLQQEFSLEPEAVSVRTGGSFVLDCRVAYKAGQCQWSKDGEPVEVEAEAAYQWVSADQTATGSNHIYDCSLAVSGAEAARDDGQWSCSVSEAAMEDGTVVVAAIESAPVEVTVRPIEQLQQKKSKGSKTAGGKAKKSAKSEL